AALGDVAVVCRGAALVGALGVGGAGAAVAGARLREIAGTGGVAADDARVLELAGGVAAVAALQVAVVALLARLDDAVPARDGVERQLGALARRGGRARRRAGAAARPGGAPVGDADAGELVGADGARHDRGVGDGDRVAGGERRGEERGEDDRAHAGGARATL